MRRRVVVTGLGVISPVGNTVTEAWDNLVAGKSGITAVTRPAAPSRMSWWGPRAGSQPVPTP